MNENLSDGGGFTAHVCVKQAVEAKPVEPVEGEVKPEL